MDAHRTHEPTDVDETEAIRLQGIIDGAGLGAAPAAGRGRCDGCRYYLNPGDRLAYCWHPSLRILVGASWRCDHHEPAPEGIA